MSPRSEEFMAGARDRLSAAQATLEAESFSGTASLAYYAMLYAVRAALSEEDRYAKTHTGTWNLFKKTFVETGRFSRELYKEGRNTQRTREAADYDALMLSRDEAEEIVALAARFVRAIEEML